MISVCYFGTYNPKHTRNRNLIQGLHANGIQVVECNVHGMGIIASYIELVKIHYHLRKNYSVMIIGFPGHLAVPLGWFLCKLGRKKLIFDAFISLYDSLVLDQKKYSKKSLPALKYWLIDWLSASLADIILMEANEYIKYYSKTFKIPLKKFRRIFVGADDSLIKPEANKRGNNDFLVHFHGSYLPLQGIPYIIKAAKILEKENIKFNIIGKLDDYSDAIKQSKELNIKNINFIDYVPYQKLSEYMLQADVCLGKFGDSDKAKRCIAFKIVEAMAMQKPLITADTPAVRELLRDRENCLLCKISDSRDLADKIRILKNSPDLREKIAENAYNLFKNKLTPMVLGRELKEIILTIT